MEEIGPSSIISPLCHFHVVEFKQKVDPTEVLFLDKLNKEEVDLDFQKEENKALVMMIKFVQTWKAISFMIFNYHQVVRQICQIKFPTLRFLYLSGNQIQSIQGLNRTYLPLIEKLRLRYNRMNKVRQLKKIHWPKIQSLNFSNGSFLYDNPGNNKILDFEELTKMSGKNLQFIGLEDFRSASEQSPDIKWMLKLEAKFLNNINVCSDERMTNKNLLNALKLKMKK